MTSFTVATGITNTAAKTVGNNDTGTVAAGGTLNVTGTAITWNAGSASPGVAIDNSGTISATTRAIDTSGSFTTGSFTLTNHSGATLIASGNDAFRINTNISNGTITVDNSGYIVSGALDTSNHIVAQASGQALDFAAIVSPTAVINITNHAGAVIGASGDDAIRPGAGHITITNDGLIDATASASRAINLSTSNLTNITEFHLINNTDGTIQSQGDTVRITASTLTATAAYAVDVDNAGTIMSTGATGANNGQAIDFADLVSTAGSVHIINEASGLISAADADAIRAGVNTTVDNHGHIVSNNAAGDSGDDGIDFQGNGGGVVNNYSDGVIDGARHGITGDLPITVSNDGIITGHLGSGINMDTASLSMTHITNHGTIIGTGGYLGGDPAMPVDGDGVDIDGLLTLNNYGTIQATGVHVVDPVTMEVELQEAVTIGGGVINNYAGATITSFERAITVDDSGGGGGPGGSNGSNGGNAWAPTTIYNEGLIHGGNGQAISITDTFADTVTNKGVIEGSVSTGGGDDVFNLYSGSSITGVIDGGDGTDVVNLLGTGAGAVGTLVNVETVNLFSGNWTLGSESMNVVDFAGTATLQLASNLLADGHFGAVIDGFANVDTIDLAEIGLASSATLGAHNVLTIWGGAGGPITLQLDQAQSFAGFVFQVASDGMGGTDLSLAKVIDGGNGNDLLIGTVGNDIINGGNGNDTIISGDGNDNLSGGNGDDVLQAGNGNSVFDGGNGDDILIAGNGGSNLTGGNGNDTLKVGNGNSVLDGGNGDDILIAGNGNSSLTGGNGNDTLKVGDGNNTLDGGNGNDILQVEAGNNTLSGGLGSDTFVFGPDFAKDVITDFSHGDHVEFGGGVFADFAAVQAATHQVGADAVIILDPSHSITLEHVMASTLHASDFVFG